MFETGDKVTWLHQRIFRNGCSETSVREGKIIAIQGEYATVKGRKREHLHIIRSGMRHVGERNALTEALFGKEASVNHPDRLV